MLSRIRILWIGLSAVRSSVIADELGGARMHTRMLRWNSVFHPPELHFLLPGMHTRHAQTAATGFSCGSESVCGICVMMLPAVEQLSIHKIIQTLSSDSKYA